MSRLLSIAVSVFLLSSCTDFTKYSTEAQSLVSQYGPQLAGLLKDHESLISRLKTLPAQFPGVAEMLQKATSSGAKLTSLKALVDGLPASVASAIASKDEGAVQKLLASFKTEVTAGVAEGKSQLQGLAAEAGVLEAKVAEAAKAAAAQPTEFVRQLPTGFSLKGNVTGVEAGLVGFIEDASKPVDKTTWFNFDKLVFTTGSANLDLAQSKDQLVNVAEILKAYPAVNLKVGGYTDNQGNPAANKKLSEARAKAVVGQLTGLGIAAKRLDPEGYGPEFPICAANDTDECRAKNRRISLRVTAK